MEQVHEHSTELERAEKLIQMLAEALAYWMPPEDEIDGYVKKDQHKWKQHIQLLQMLP